MIRTSLVKGVIDQEKWMKLPLVSARQQCDCDCIFPAYKPRLRTRHSLLWTSIRLRQTNHCLALPLPRKNHPKDRLRCDGRKKIEFLAWSGSERGRQNERGDGERERWPLAHMLRDDPQQTKCKDHRTLCESVCVCVSSGLLSGFTVVVVMRKGVVVPLQNMLSFPKYSTWNEGWFPRS